MRAPIRLRRLTRAPLLLATASALLIPTTAGAEDSGKLLLMLDASGSMKENDRSGVTKMAAAKRALLSVVDALPDNSRVGLRVYGAQQPGGRPTPAACADSQLVHPISTLDRKALRSAIRRFQAKGETPIAYALRRALSDLGSGGQRNIVLVSDGEESCVPDPCKTVRQLKARGVGLQIDTVGFSVGAKARKQLRCIAEVTDGSYFDARDSDALAASLNKLSQRAVRPFSARGKAVTATPKVAGAPTLTPGRYTDRYDVSPSPRFYRLARQKPGSVLHFSLVARPSARSERTDGQSWAIELETPDGEQCGRDADTAIEFYRRGRSMTASASAGEANAGQPDSKDWGPCGSARELVASVTHEDGAGVTDVQLLVTEEPVAGNAGSLPAALRTNAAPQLLAPAGPLRRVVGGGSFWDAPRLTPGTYRDTLLPGEQVYYRVPLSFGQKAIVSARISAPKQTGEYTSGNIESWTPALANTTRAGGSPENRDGITPQARSLVVTEYVPEIRYLNKLSGSFQLRPFSIAGDYYFAVARDAQDPQPMLLTLSVKVGGIVRGIPEPASGNSDPPTSTTPAAQTDELTTTASSEKPKDKTNTPWLLLIGAACALAVALLAASRRRNR